LQAGWKRTGEIAAKGSLYEKWAIFRVSGDLGLLLVCFTADKRITSKFNSGKWKKGSRRRGSLGAESDAESSGNWTNVHQVGQISQLD
jgi:hypothetical protein